MPLCIQAIHKHVHTFNIKTITNQRINYIQESLKRSLNQNKVFCFLISKDFIVYIDTFIHRLNKGSIIFKGSYQFPTEWSEKAVAVCHKFV